MYNALSCPLAGLSAYADVGGAIFLVMFNKGLINRYLLDF